MDHKSQNNSNKPKLFIHIPKNAGMTIRDSEILKSKITTLNRDVYFPFLYPDLVRQTMMRQGDHTGLEHARYRDALPYFVDQFQAFAVVRNPWDRVVSRFFFAKKVIEVEKKESVGKHNVNSFEEFLEERHEWGNKEYMWHRAIRGWFPAFDYVTDDRNRVCVDILRFEHLNEDLCKYFNIPQMTRARNVTALNKGRYTDLYTPQTIQIVADWYHKDIEEWGYDFASGPSRNYWNL